MRYYHLPRFTGVDALQLGHRDVGAIGPHQVLVRMRAWSLNYRDLLIAGGNYGRDVRPDVVPLSDGAGEVVETGTEVTQWKRGDRVVSTFLPRWGAGPMDAAKAADTLGGSVDGVLAEYVTFDEQAVVAAPAHMSFEEAATLPCAAVTAWHSVVVLGSLTPGQSVLTLGTGGVSVFALQFAVIGGAQVITTSSSDNKLERLHDLGAAHLMNYVDMPEWGKAVFELTGTGVDHVIEVGGAGTLRQSIDAVRTGGRISVIGMLTQGQGFSPIPLVRKGIAIQGVLVGSRVMFEAMNQALEHHRIRPVIDKTFPFSDAISAYRYLESGRHVGKVVITAD